MKGGPSANLNLKILFWNVNGRMRFLNDNNILSWIQKFNIIFITETHMTKGQVFDIPGFKPFHNPSSTIFDKKSRGGISCFVTIPIYTQIQHLDCSFDSHIVVTFKDGSKIFGSYIPPTDSPYFNPSIISCIPLFFQPFYLE